MKQYLDKQQTAKLIELGFEKPKSYHDIEWDGTEAYDYQLDYSIGELMEILPISFENDNDDTTWLEIEAGAVWDVSYVSFRLIDYNCERNELIDALYDMIVKLKENGKL